MDFVLSIVLLFLLCGLAFFIQARVIVYIALIVLIFVLGGTALFNQVAVITIAITVALIIAIFLFLILKFGIEALREDRELRKAVGGIAYFIIIVSVLVWGIFFA